MSEQKSVVSQDKPNLSWSLHQWTDYLLSIHPKNIDMGLERTQSVFTKLGLDFSAQRVVTVAGTNGKGTTCRMIENGLLMANKTVAVYSSPHLIDYKERVRVNDQLLTDADHVAAFMQVEKARGNISLTFFEFATLAAFVLIKRFNVDYVLLEVGLGGRLDAVNVVKPDLAVITNIDLDHQDWLGDTRELIAVEKAGILRHNIPAVIGDEQPPQSLVSECQRFNANTSWQGKSFTYTKDKHHWQWHNGQAHYTELPFPHIPIQNASTALQVLSVLNISLSDKSVSKLIAETRLPGRFQQVRSSPKVFLDVAHNPQAVGYLKQRILQQPYKTLRIVVAMLADKDVETSLKCLNSLDALWYVASLDAPRGAPNETLKSVLTWTQKVLTFESVELAYQQAIEDAEKDDMVIVFGSFFTVSQVMNVLAN
ncbi:bifunctional tetrahydrofolate synthase/dihydrofolate synthase [Aliiglaciecola sp. M165]|uniref:bifunctional tetrahydrofolate synthase/dihydrofolate synthase n=1 Tax=Aliiglaciecola sp. M165 TaxID=2593649 RepID=UPI001180B1D7|nr:bifunctional tetrahydrofolate synthase/dihydrofolate synthase [Aliiglaciecola sp. M165]TRY29392.1 bifunctional tetrahydrofolate synthase/dihydrofolate synthase [Aliiglaciecola sp. M165]